MRKLLFILLLLSTSHAKATIYCATSGVDLQNKMDLAACNGQSDEIRIVTGTHTSNFHAPQAPQWDYDNCSSDDTTHVAISGGWSSGNNCATQVSQDPATTVLDAQTFGPVFQVNFHAVPTSGSFSLRNLTLTRGKSFIAGMPSGLSLGGGSSGSTSFIVENVMVTSGTASVDSVNAIEVNLNGSGSFRLRNSIVRNNIHTGTVSSAVDIRLFDSAIGYISNNSIFANSGTRINSGLAVRGIATLTNNAVADNSSTANPNYQFFSSVAHNLTLRNNHFATRGYSGTPFFAETNTTTGSALWTLSGSVMVPNVGSPLRDSGLNNPVGGALSIDFRGNPRIVNTTMDRGAIEAEAPPQVGPLITPNSPAAGSTTLLIGEPGGGPAFGNITFNTSGGTAPGTTQINCQVSSGTLQIGANPTQVVGVGQAPGAVLVGFDSTATPQTGVIFCQFIRAGVAGSTFAAYTFTAGPELLFKNGFE